MSESRIPPESRTIPEARASSLIGRFLSRPHRKAAAGGLLAGLLAISALGTTAGAGTEDPPLDAGAPSLAQPPDDATPGLDAPSGYWTPGWDLTRGFPLADDADTSDVQREISDTTFVMQVSGQPFAVPYFSPALLEEEHPAATRAVFSIHGTLRNARDYLQAVLEASQEVPGADSTAYLIAPQFLTEADVAADTLPDTFLFWKYMGWRQGDSSHSTLDHPRPAALSSFAVLDSMIHRLARRSPGLSTIVVAGHSAGGQFVNRYAAGTPLVEELRDQFGITLRFVVANPSCYLYLDETRWTPGLNNFYAVPPPEEISRCPDYDLYKYGLRDPNEYMNQGAETLRQRYSSRLVQYLLGGKDIDPNQRYLERNCAAMLQGEHRLQRGLLYRGYLRAIFGAGIIARHQFYVIPGVGHDATGVFTSACGIYALFQHGSCTPNLPSPAWDDRSTFALRAPGPQAVSWGDFDGDQLPDLFLASPDSADRLFRNGGDGTFTDVSGPPLADPRDGISAAWADVDQDGLLDLYAVNRRSENRLFRNLGSGVFVDDTPAPLAAGGDQQEAGWIDFDRDGDLDVYLTRSGLEPDIFLRNDGEAGWTDITHLVPQDSVNSRDTAWGDYDSDGDPDLYVAGVGSGSNRLLRNDDSLFVDVTAPPLGGGSLSASACWGDFDNDRDLDLLVVSSSGRAMLYRNDGASFSEVESEVLSSAGPGRCASWGDFDNDGDLDIYLVCRGARNRLFRNDGGGMFTDLASYPVDDMGLGVCFGWADYDGDGNLDLFVANETNWNKLFRNRGGSDNHWLEVDLRGAASNSRGIGARVLVTAGGQTQIREIGAENGLMGQSAATAHFGLGLAATVDTLRVYWPGGIVQELPPGLAADQRITITESGVSAAPGLSHSGAFLTLLATPAPNPSALGATLRFLLSSPAVVALSVHDAAGRLVGDAPTARPFPAGPHEVAWSPLDRDGRRCPAGVYFGRLLAREAARGGAERAIAFRVILLP